MAGCTEHLSDVLGTLSINNGQLDENQRTQLKENIENNYESIFSWDIQQLTGGNKNHKFNLIDKIREELEMIIDKDNEYNLNRFYLQLIVSYELYISKSYNESYKEIENIVKFMKKCKFDESNKYSDAYYHIAQATYAYIALSLKIDSEKLLKNVKEIKSFNPEEKAAVCAVKARVFMQYSPKGNDIALKFADQAKNLDSTEPKWIVIWLKAKGRVRRYYEQFAMPENDEMDAAKILASAKTNAGLLIKASKVYLEAAFVNKLKNNREESNKYYKLSYDITKKSVELAKDDIQQLYSCLLICIEYPKELLSKSMMENLIAKLKNLKNSYVDEILGKYYLKHEKDYEEAKIHLSRGKDAGNFNSSLQLIKVECLLQPVNKFPLVQELNMMYDVFPSPKRRLIILSQILIYYNYCENNPKEMIRYLKMYIDQDIEDTFKKRHLIFAYPFFKINGFKPKQFLNVLSIKLKELVNNNKWSLEERKMIDNTFDRFNKISKLNLYDNKTTFHSKNDNKMYPSDKGKNESWRKQKIDLSSQDEFNNIHQHQFASKYYVNQKNSLEKHAGRVIEPLTNQHKEIYNSFEMYPNNKNKFWRKQKVDLSSKSKEL